VKQTKLEKKGWETGETIEKGWVENRRQSHTLFKMLLKIKKN
jgi:hypothetical protein